MLHSNSGPVREDMVGGRRARLEAEWRIEGMEEEAERGRMERDVRVWILELVFGGD